MRGTKRGMGVYNTFSSMHKFESKVEGGHLLPVDSRHLHDSLHRRQCAHETKLL